MRIAILHPTYWPEVLRGAERIVHDLAAGMAARGHDVTVLTTHPRRRSVTVEDGFTVVRARRAPGGPLDRFGFEPYLATVPETVLALARGRFDVAHALSPVNGWAAARARKVGGPPFVLSLMGLPTERSVGSRRLRRRLMLGAIRAASATTTLSEAAAAALRESLGCRATALLGAVYGHDFRSDRPRADAPTLLCTASLDDPRKRGPLLLRAFTRLREERPDVRLLVAGGGDPQQGRPPIELPAGASRLEATSGAEFTDTYAVAWATVLASVDEALGVVLAESLAAGTPVVAARSGGCPEIVSDEGVGRLFTPDDEDDLVRALDEALELSLRPETAARCRARADELDWSRWLPRYEALYTEAVTAK